MDPFLASVTSELENIHKEHSRILQRLRGRQQQRVCRTTSFPEDFGVPSCSLDPECAGVVSAQGSTPAPWPRPCLEEVDLVEICKNAGNDLPEEEEEEGEDASVGGDEAGPSGMLRKSWFGEVGGEVGSHGSEDMSSGAGEHVDALRSSSAGERAAAECTASSDEWASSMTPRITFASAQPLALRDEWLLSVELVRTAVQDDEGKEAEELRDELEEECISILHSVCALDRKSSKAFASLTDGGSVLKLVSRDRSTNFADLAGFEQDHQEYKGVLWAWCRRCRQRISSRPSLPLSPRSSERLAWDVIGFVFVLYEMVTIPLLLLVIPSTDSLSVTFDVVLNCYWSLDMALSFITCVEVDGSLRAEYRTIIWHYAKTWFAIDFLMVFVEWLLFSLRIGGGAGFQALRVLRVFRVFRLLRAVKLEHAVRRHVSRINSSSVLNIMSLIQLLFVFLLLNHLIACTWYLIGRESSDGWLNRDPLCQDGEDAPACYILALLWAVSQFHGTADLSPGNIPERLFAVSTQVLGLLIASIFVSAITDMLLLERQGRHKLNERREKVRKYFLCHTVSSEVMLGVKSYLKSTTNDKEWVDDHEVLEGLPLWLQKDVICEARMPVVEKHWLFSWLKSLHAHELRTICCSGFDVMHHLAGSLVFRQGDPWAQLVFVQHGQTRYVPTHSGGQTAAQARRNSQPAMMLEQISNFQVGTKICEKEWLCELALWLKGWQSRGDLVSLSNSSLLGVDSVKFTKVLAMFPAARLNVVMYVNGLLQDLTKAGLSLPSLSDVWKPRHARDRSGSSSYGTTFAVRNFRK